MNQFKTNPHQPITLAPSHSHEYEADTYTYRLAIPLSPGFDLQTIAEEARLGWLNVACTREQLRQLRDALDRELTCITAITLTDEQRRQLTVDVEKL